MLMGANEPVEQDLGPEVRILQDKNAIIEEYRSQGQVYMIKIKPVQSKKVSERKFSKH